MFPETMRAEAERTVADWIVRQPSDELFKAATCQVEILIGFTVLPSGRRRAEMEEAARGMFVDDFYGRILPFKTKAAAAYAKVLAARRKAGRLSGTIDLMLAAIARIRAASVVNRNVTDFEAVSVAIVNPWDE